MPHSSLGRAVAGRPRRPPSPSSGGTRPETRPGATPPERLRRGGAGGSRGRVCGGVSFAASWVIAALRTEFGADDPRAAALAAQRAGGEVPFRGGGGCAVGGDQLAGGRDLARQLVHQGQDVVWRPDN